MKRTGGCAGVVCSDHVISADPGGGGEFTGAEESTAEAEGPYVVKKGDTLWGSPRTCSRTRSFAATVGGESAVKDPNLIYPGDALTLPGKEIAPAPVAEAPRPNRRRRSRSPAGRSPAAPKPSPARHRRRKAGRAAPSAIHPRRGWCAAPLDDGSDGG